LGDDENELVSQLLTNCEHF